MMARRRTRFHLVHDTCRRCNAPIMTGNRSLYGADDLKARFGSICSRCFLPEEAPALDRAYRHRLAAEGAYWRSLVVDDVDASDRI